MITLRQALRREGCLQRHQLQALSSTWLFYCMILLFFPLALPADSQLLRTVFPGILWISLLFVFVLAAERLFHDEEQDGVLEQWLLPGRPLLRHLYAKLYVHWLVHALPLALCTPLFAMMFNFSAMCAFPLAAAILFGTPCLFLFAALSAGFATGVAQKSMFMVLISLPLSLPVLILGSGCVTAIIAGLPFTGLLALLLALSLLSGLILPGVLCAILRLQVN
jgi:heme exporter protein B